MAFTADIDTAELPDCPLLSENMVPRHHCSSWLSLLSSSLFVFPLGVDLFSYFFFFEIISTFSNTPSTVILLNSSSFLILLLSFYPNWNVYFTIIPSLVLEWGRKCFFFNLNFIDYWCLSGVHAHIWAMVHVRISKGIFQESGFPLAIRFHLLMLSVLTCRGGTSTSTCWCWAFSPTWEVPVLPSESTWKLCNHSQFMLWFLCLQSSGSSFPLLCWLISFDCFFPNIHLLHEDFFNQCIHLKRIETFLILLLTLKWFHFKNVAV